MRRRRFVLVIALLVAVSGCTTTQLLTGRLKSYYIPSGAMENTLRIDDHVGVRPHAHVARGSIVVFVGPASWQDAPEFGSAKPRQFVKRVIGMPGDHVVCCDAHHAITVNGVPLVESYLYPGDVPSEEKFDVVVPAGRVFVLGDHRSESADSRAHLADGFSGTVPLASIVGVVVRVLSPGSHARPLPTPSYAGTPVTAQP